jgi:hypothetical protein
MAHDVFICHSSKDKTVADAACAVLEQHGIRCWIAPRDVMPGASWAGSIVHAIEGSKFMLLIFSENANDSPQIEREVERAVNHGIPVVPFRIKDILPTEALEYFISASHWLDAYSPPISRHYQTLAGKIETLLAAQESHVAGDPPPAAALEPSPAPAPPSQAPPRRLPLAMMIGGGAVLAVLLVAVLVALVIAIGGRSTPPAASQSAAPALSATPVASQSAAVAPESAAAPQPLASSLPSATPAFVSYPINLNPNGDNWVALRSAPNDAGVRLDKLGPDAQFAVTETQGDWSQVQLPDGRTGWVASHFIGCCRPSPN